jgi:hypothetical protein
VCLYIYHSSFDGRQKTQTNKANKGKKKLIKNKPKHLRQQKKEALAKVVATSQALFGRRGNATKSKGN